MNKLPHSIRMHVEQQLDLTRADPGAADNVVSLRIYNPEINTYEKLTALLLEGILEESETTIHPSSIRRIGQDYLKEKGFQIKFTDSDHNACGFCKDMSHAAFRFNHDVKRIEEQLRKNGIPFAQRQRLGQEHSIAKYEENETIASFASHR